MHLLTKSMVALGFAGAITVSAPSPTLAQGVYFHGPGVEIGVGRPYYRERYYDYDRPYRYRPYVEERRYYRRYRNWD
jgi:hypothetical protein